MSGHLPPFAVVSRHADRKLVVSSAATARQAFMFCREDIRAASDRVDLLSTDANLPELLEAMAALAETNPHVLALRVVTELAGYRTHFQWAFSFTRAEEGLLLALSSVAPITPSVPLVGRVPREGLKC